MIGCPSTPAAVQISSDKLKCSPPLVYHCLTDQNGRLTQKCIKPSWIQTGHCAEYNTIAQKLDSKACAATPGLCPQKPYLSNDVISFSGCAPSDPKISITTVTSSKDINTESDGTDVASIVIPIIIVILLICTVIGATVYICKRRSQQETKRNKSIDGKKEEEYGLVDYVKKEEIREHLQREAKELEFFDEVAKYVPVFDMEIVQEAMNALSHVVLVGKPGSGKTTLAWNMCKRLHGERLGNQNCFIKVSKRDIQVVHLGENDRMILLLDNYLESASIVAAEKKLKALDGAYHDMLANHRIILILTMNHHDFIRLSDILPDTLNVLKIGESLNTSEIGKMLEAHEITLHENKEYKSVKEKQFLEDEKIAKKKESLFNKSVPIGFPLMISLAAANSSFWKSFASFSKKPVDFIFDSVWTLQKSGNPDDRDRFCTIIYTALHGGKLVNDAFNRDLFNTIAKTHKVMNANPRMDHYLLRCKGNGIWEFYHDVPIKILLSCYGKKQPEILVTKCPLHILLRYCVSQPENSEDRMFSFVIEKKDHIKKLIERVINEKEDVKSHRMWEDKEFRKIYSDVEKVILPGKADVE